NMHIKTGWLDVNDLSLRNKVEVQLKGGGTAELEVIWNRVSSPVYDKNSEGRYLFIGEFVLQEGITSPDGCTAESLYVLVDAVVNVSYVDEEGTRLTKDEILQGPVSTKYITEEKEFTGYTLIEIPANAFGKFARNDINVQYVYKKNPKIDPDDPID